MPFVELDIETDPRAIVEGAIAYIRETHPEFSPAPANLARLILEAEGEEAAQQRFHLSEISEEAIRSIGFIVGVPPISPAAAVGETTWTFTDDSGYEIPAGTTIALNDVSGSAVAFSVVETVVIPNGETEATEVAIEALEEGSAGTGLSGAAELLSDVDGVVSVVIDGVTTIGTDGESDDEFLTRWSERMQLLADRLLTAPNFALYYRTAVDTCYRAVALDTYNPLDDTFDNEGYITVVGITVDGADLPNETQTAAVAAMSERTVGGVRVRSMNPTRTEIPVAVEVVAVEGFELEEVETQVEAALESYLSPGRWGSDVSGVDPRSWFNERFVRYLEVSAVINNVPGVHYVLEPTLLIDGDYNTDIELPGRVPLTEPGEISITVHPSGYEPEGS